MLTAHSIKTTDICGIIFKNNPLDQVSEITLVTCLVHALNLVYSRRTTQEKETYLYVEGFVVHNAAIRNNQKFFFGHKNNCVSSFLIVCVCVRVLHDASNKSRLYGALVL